MTEEENYIFRIFISDWDDSLLFMGWMWLTGAFLFTWMHKIKWIVSVVCGFTLIFIFFLLFIEIILFFYNSTLYLTLSVFTGNCCRFCCWCCQQSPFFPVIYLFINFYLVFGIISTVGPVSICSFGSVVSFHFSFGWSSRGIFDFLFCSLSAPGNENKAQLPLY